MKVADIYTEVRLKQDKLDGDFEKLRRDVDKKGERLGKSFGGSFGKSIGGSLKKALIAGGGIVVLQKFVGFIKNAITLYSIQEAAEKRLSVAYGKNIKNLKDYAAELQSQTAYGDEAIIEAEALIAAFVKEEGSIKRATKATLDLAAAKGMDLKVAADLLSKTLGSSTNALSRYGIEVKGAVGSSERLNSAMKNLNARFGGQASAQLDTYAGKVQALDNAWGDLLETIGHTSVQSIFAGIKTLFSGGSFATNLALVQMEEHYKKVADEAIQSINSQKKQKQVAVDTVKSIKEEIAKLKVKLEETDISDIVSRDKTKKLIESKEQIIKKFLEPLILKGGELNKLGSELDKLNEKRPFATTTEELGKIDAKIFEINVKMAEFNKQAKAYAFNLVNPYKFDNLKAHGIDGSIKVPGLPNQLNEVVVPKKPLIESANIFNNEMIRGANEFGSVMQSVLGLAANSFTQSLSDGLTIFMKILNIASAFTPGGILGNVFGGATEAVASVAKPVIDVSSVTTAIEAMNNNMLAKRSPTQVHVYVGGREITEQVHIDENRMNRANTQRTVAY